MLHSEEDTSGCIGAECGLAAGLVQSASTKMHGMFAGEQTRRGLLQKNVGPLKNLEVPMR